MCEREKRGRGGRRILRADLSDNIHMNIHLQYSKHFESGRVCVREERRERGRKGKEEAGKMESAKEILDRGRESGLSQLHKISSHFFLH